MTGWALFRTRLFDDFKFQRKIISTVVDWVVLLYIILSPLIFAVIIYIDVWRDITSYWFPFIPFSAVVNLLLLFSLHGRFRTFIQEADILFLLERSKLYKSLRSWSFVYSLFHLIAGTVLLIIIALPFLVQGYGLELQEILFLLLFLIGYRLTIYTIKKMIYHPVLRWIIFIFVYIFSANLAGSVSYMYLALAGVILVIFWSSWYVMKAIPAKRFYFQEVSDENKERLRYAKFILGLSSEVDKPSIRIGKRPLFNRKSRRFFRKRTPENGLFELLLKGFIRNSMFLTSYLQVIWLTFFAIMVLPIWAKWLVLIIAVLFLQYNSWLRGLFEKMLNQHFFIAVPINENVREKVWLRFKRLLFIPAVSLLGIATIVFSVLAIWGGS
ncbi:ABC transporter permease [Oceanobacillus sp. FSL H7-0719]|uniref:ABC transporter permease n=1 Tax=Oceanobacillus sp. FSL H7-0719 TaxID=2954507 RepID=UPI00325410E9